MSGFVSIDSEKFRELAEAAAKDGCLMARDCENGLGIEYAIILNGHVFARSTPTEDGEHLYEYKAL